MKQGARRLRRGAARIGWRACRNLRALCSVLGLCLLASPPAWGAAIGGSGNAAAAAVNAAPAPSLRPSPLTADQIVARNVSARGGLGAWRGVQTLTMAGRMDAGQARRDGPMDQPVNSRFARAQTRAEVRTLLEAGRRGEAPAPKMIQLPFLLEQKRGRKQRIEIEFQGQKAVQVYDGQHGWKLRPFLGRHEAEPFSSTEAALAAQEQELDGALIDYRAKGTRIAVDGIDAVRGHDAYKLRLTLANGAIRHVWVDASSFLEVKIDGSRRLDGKQVAVETFIRDYRAVDGLMIPFATETQVAGVSYSEKIQVESVALNQALDDALFTKPH